jgi:segregation and condensation protein A
MAHQVEFDDFEVTVPVPMLEDDVLTLELGSWEGPLDLLLALARNQKVDLREISILALVNQYLIFINNARALKLEIAADYLVMAAWLAYLKSCLLLPREPHVEPSPEELALRLQLRLERLNAMREAGARLLARDRLGRDVFLRCAPEGLKTIRTSNWDAQIFDLIQAYGHVRARAEPPIHFVARRHVMSLEDAIARVSRLVGTVIEWTMIEQFLPESDDPQFRRSAMASSFVAALELAKQGKIGLRQDEAFAPLYIRNAA